MKLIKELLYTKEHEWIKVEENKAYIGITDYAQTSLGSIVFVELPEEDSEFNAGDNFATVESVKAAADIYIPISGKILSINEEIVDDPSLVNKDPYENWMVLIEISNEDELSSLLKAEEYEAICNKED